MRKHQPYDVMPFCRCGRKSVWGRLGPECPNSNSKAKDALFTKHDMVAQLYALGSNEINWEVRQEADGRFCAYASAHDFSPKTHANENAAWRELDAVMWSEIEWPDSENLDEVA
jgi:hypothetical protein